MHDIGIMVFCYLIPDEYIEFLRSVQDEEVPLEVREYKKFGIDHPELGAVFIKKWWQVDDHILQAVRYHHFPFVGLESDKRCEQMVHIATAFAALRALQTV